jgi:hypothetical protein
MTVNKDALGRDELDAELFWFDRFDTARGIVSRDNANILMY